MPPKDDRTIDWIDGLSQKKIMLFDIIIAYCHNNLIWLPSSHLILSWLTFLTIYLTWPVKPAIYLPQRRAARLSDPSWSSGLVINSEFRIVFLAWGGHARLPRWGLLIASRYASDFFWTLLLIGSPWSITFYVICQTKFPSSSSARTSKNFAMKEKSPNKKTPTIIFIMKLNLCFFSLSLISIITVKLFNKILSQFFLA